VTDYSPPPAGGMYEEIDLRPYVRALLAHWYWIVGAGVLAGLLTLLVSFLLVPNYEASALIAITQPRFNIRFDPRLETTEQTTISAQVYAELALSDDVVQALYQSLEPLPEGVETAFDLRELLSAEPGADRSLLRLVAHHPDPVVAANLANAWAEVFLALASQVYGIQGDAPLAFLENQLVAAEGQLAEAEQALVLFQGENESRILTSRLLAYQLLLEELVTAQQQTRLVQQDVVALRGQLGAQAGNGVSGAEELTAVLLQLKSYGLGGETSPNLQLLISEESRLLGLARPAQISFLDELSNSLVAKEASLGEEIARLEPEIKQTQTQLQQAEAALNQLTTARNVAQETYQTLSRTVAEAQISSQDTTGQIQLASRAAVPLEPASTSRLLLVLVAGVAGGLLGAVVVLVRRWWES
jgi:uncharacterized protein involved in exopolysaccharide biosynthesis